MNIFIYILCINLGIFSFTLANADTLSVITKENAIREDCRFFSPIKAKVRYNDILDVTSIEGDWFRVKFKNLKGCIHKSAVEKKQFSLSGLFVSKEASASRDEVALAGKGFNPQVENAYKKNHPEMNYHDVEIIEGYNVSEESLKKFIQNGGLNFP